MFGVGGIARDVLKIRKVIEFQSSWIVIYFKTHVSVLLQPNFAGEVSGIRSDSDKQVI